MEIFSASDLKKSNKNFLMKQTQIENTLRTLLSSGQIKWNNPTNEVNTKLISISGIILSKDYKHIKILASPSSLADNEINFNQAINDLNRDINPLKHALTKKLSLRKAPSVVFKIDNNTSSVSNVEALLDSLKK